MRLVEEFQSEEGRDTGKKRRRRRKSRTLLIFSNSVGVVSLRFWKENESGGAVTVMLRNPNSRDVFRARLKPCVK